MQISEIFDQLTSDLEVWKELTTQFQADVFCGLFLSTGNDGMSFSPETLLLLGERGLEVVLDVYNHSDH